ncbi:hypothetical protein BZG36_04052 [Bifiguratus adelaidae]|uniref:Bromo domain-containing protein n=1 Tax=Bifiguratus adelaidae TaxID=1938954 RepID=A0A261XWF1_9FUNG|nr:hypothetical protein BZG36_04052 [Bifiguratus adelaidae]
MPPQIALSHTKQNLPVYFPGQTIEGFLLLDVSSLVQVQELKISLVGSVSIPRATLNAERMSFFCTSMSFFRDLQRQKVARTRGTTLADLHEDPSESDDEIREINTNDGDGWERVYDDSTSPIRRASELPIPIPSYSRSTIHRMASISSTPTKFYHSASLHARKRHKKLSFFNRKCITSATSCPRIKPAYCSDPVNADFQEDDKGHVNDAIKARKIVFDMQDLIAVPSEAGYTIHADTTFNVLAVTYEILVKMKVTELDRHGGQNDGRRKTSQRVEKVPVHVESTFSLITLSSDGSERYADFETRFGRTISLDTIALPITVGSVRVEEDLHRLAMGLYYLISRFLETGQCRKAAAALKDDLAENYWLTPKRYDWKGQAHVLTACELDARYKHIDSAHLHTLFTQFIKAANELYPPPAQNITSVLGFHDGASTRQDSVHTRVLRGEYVGPVSGKSGWRAYNTFLSSQGRKYLGRTNIAEALSLREIGCRSVSPKQPPTYIGKEYELLVQISGHRYPAFNVVFDRTGLRFATGSDDWVVKLWCARTGILIHTFRGHQNVIADIAINEENTLIAAAATDGIIRIWNLKTFAPVAVLMNPLGANNKRKPFLTVSFSPSPKAATRYLLATAEDGNARIWKWDRDTLKFETDPVVLACRVKAKDELHCGSFNATGTQFAVAGDDGFVRVFSTVATPEMILSAQNIMIESASSPRPRGRPPKAHIQEPPGPQFQPGNGPILIGQLEGHKGDVNDLAYSHSGNRILSGSVDGTARVWSMILNEPWSCVILDVKEDPPQYVVEKHERERAQQQAQLAATIVADAVVNGEQAPQRPVEAIDGGLWENGVFKYPNKVTDLIWSLDDDLAIVATSYGADIKVFDPLTGDLFVVVDTDGMSSLYGVGRDKEAYAEAASRALSGQQFETDYFPLRFDERLYCVDEQTQIPPHLIPHGPVLNWGGLEYSKQLPENYGRNIPLKLVDGKFEQEEAQRLAEYEAEENQCRRLKLAHIAKITPIDKNKIVRQRKDWARTKKVEEEPDYTVINDLPLLPLHDDSEDDDFEAAEESSEESSTASETDLEIPEDLNDDDTDEVPWIENDDGGYSDTRARPSSSTSRRTRNRSNGWKRKSAKKGRPQNTKKRRTLVIDDEDDEAIGPRRRGYVPGTYRESGSDFTSEPSSSSESEPESGKANNDTDGQTPRQGTSKAKSKAKFNVADYAPSSWIRETRQLITPYHPQIGDIVAYFKEGHAQYLRQSRMLNFFAERNGPRVNMDTVVFCEVKSINWQVGPPTWCRVKFKVLDCINLIQVVQRAASPIWKAEQGEFTVDFCDEDGAPEFLVLAPRFFSSLQLNLQIGQYINGLFAETIYAGRIVGYNQDISQIWNSYPPGGAFSPWQCFQVEWVSEPGSIDNLSPWELTPSDVSAQDLYSSRDTLDDATVQRTRDIFVYVINREEYGAFIEHVDWEEVPGYLLQVAYPMCVDMIERRVNDGFYRRPQALLYDVDLIAKNCNKYNEPSSLIARMSNQLARFIKTRLEDPNKPLEVDEDRKGKRRAATEDDLDDYQESASEFEDENVDIEDDVSSHELE